MPLPIPILTDTPTIERLVAESSRPLCESELVALAALLRHESANIENATITGHSTLPTQQATAARERVFAEVARRDRKFAERQG